MQDERIGVLDATIVRIKIRLGKFGLISAQHMLASNLAGLMAKKIYYSIRCGIFSTFYALLKLSPVMFHIIAYLSCPLIQQ